MYFKERYIRLRRIALDHIHMMMVMIAYFLIRLPYAGFVPLWDGAVYY